MWRKLEDFHINKNEKKKKGHMISWPLPREERERESLDDKMNLTKLEKEKKSCFEKQQTVASA